MIIRQEFQNGNYEAVSKVWLDWLVDITGSQYQRFGIWGIDVVKRHHTEVEWQQLKDEHIPSCGPVDDASESVGYIYKFWGDGYTVWISRRHKTIIDEETGRVFSRPYAIVAADIESDALAVQFKLAIL